MVLQDSQQNPAVTLTAKTCSVEARLNRKSVPRLQLEHHYKQFFATALMTGAAGTGIGNGTNTLKQIHVTECPLSSEHGSGASASQPAA